MHEDSENIKVDRVNTRSFLTYIKSNFGRFFRTPGRIICQSPYKYSNLSHFPETDF